MLVVNRFLGFLLAALVLGGQITHAQESDNSTLEAFFTPADTFNQKRFNWSLGIAATTYSAFSIGLYHTWYKNYPQSGFHFFDDGNEWLQMDKVGHAYTAYLQGVLVYKGARWTGLPHRKALWTGAICGTLFQSTIEVMDGFSEQWGFSLWDIGANTAGVAWYWWQQDHWGEQRIRLKVSNVPTAYPEDQGSVGTILRDRIDDLYGSSFAERFLKDYNSQTYWATFDVGAFLPQGNKWPSWLHLAVGYGAENLYGGVTNEWELDNGERFRLDPRYNRYRQFYIGLDFNPSSLQTKNHLVKGLLEIISIFRIPSPAIEINTRGEIHFHLFR